jgi:hypothetical protein
MTRNRRRRGLDRHCYPCRARRHVRSPPPSTPGFARLAAARAAAPRGPAARLGPAAAVRRGQVRRVPDPGRDAVDPDADQAPRCCEKCVVWVNSPVRTSASNRGATLCSTVSYALRKLDLSLTSTTRFPFNRRRRRRSSRSQRRP